MKTFTGKVISAKMQKSAIVEVDTLWQHPLYKKRLKRSKKYLAHNDLGAKEGDLVKIKQTRPQSKRKRWQITKILKEKE